MYPYYNRESHEEYYPQLPFSSRPPIYRNTPSFRGIDEDYIFLPRESLPPHEDSTSRKRQRRPLPVRGYFSSAGLENPEALKVMREKVYGAHDPLDPLHEAATASPRHNRSGSTQMPPVFLGSPDINLKEGVQICSNPFLNLHYTTPKDNTKGDNARRARLLAEFAQKHTKLETKVNGRFDVVAGNGRGNNSPKAQSRLRWKSMIECIDPEILMQMFGAQAGIVRRE